MVLTVVQNVAEQYSLNDFTFFFQNKNIYGVFLYS